eukprot:SAG11_NODE_3573_length_2359_cov_145.957522_7_plen_141_part_00
MATIERSIEEVIEEYEEETVETEEVEATPSIQRPKKKPRSQKQIDALNKAREARAKKILERKAMNTTKASQKILKPKSKSKARQVIVLDTSSSSEDEPEPLVIKRKKKKKQRRPITPPSDSSSSEEEEEYYHVPAQFRFI